jgi:hypothetical protein
VIEYHFCAARGRGMKSMHFEKGRAWLMKKVTKQAVKHIRLTQNLNLSLWMKALIVLLIVAIVLHAVLFTTYAPVHDYFHELRHSLMIIPCH